MLLTHNLSLLAVRDLQLRTDAWLTQGNRSRGKRLAQAVRLAELSEALQVEAHGQPYFLIGDFNAFEFSDGYVDVMGVLTGDPAPADQVLVHAESPLSAPLHNLTLTLPEPARYSYVFQGSAQNLDHMLVNDAVFEVGELEFTPVRLNSDFAADNADTAVVPMRTSDHDPLSLRVAVDRFIDADLSVTVRGGRQPLISGREAGLPVVVENAGPQAARRPVVMLELDVAPSQVGVVQVPDWQCDAPSAAPKGTLIRCARESAMPASTREKFEVPVMVQRTAVQDFLTLSVMVTAASNDPEFDDNQASFTWRVTGRLVAIPPKR
ncbi:MAG: hypothetical protein EA417_18325 [Gammaproteobacteria bacterium]|nr:MAG: hypothetical protein EA417_18325 [Gammaproteobacteria bacterium]